MRPVEVVEYVLSLSTGEQILVTELDPESVPSLADPAVREAAAAVLDQCTVVPRAALEDAKNGYSKPLEAVLRTPPAGCLVKLRAPACSEAGRCSSAGPGCSTAYRRPRRERLPMCWEFGPQDDGPVAVAARDLGTTVVHAWSEGRYVLIVSQ